MISITQKGSFKRTQSFLKKLEKNDFYQALQRYGDIGVQALARATPKDSGLTASSWGYTIESNSSGVAINWTNSHVNKGVVIAIILQYGHGTGTGGYVQGRDYINPAIRPVFDKLAEDVWKEVVKV